MAGCMTYSLLLATVLHVFYLLPRVSGAGCAVSEFECCAGTPACISVDYHMDERSDCADGSDEYAGINDTLSKRGCCDRPGNFHCKLGGCVHFASILDGYNECDNGNDAGADEETKYIGTDCTHTTDVTPSLCCPCSLYVPNSECLDTTGTFLCYCKSGYMEENRGRTCTLRKFGDPCVINLDCTSAVDNTMCRNLFCDCKNGWYVVNNTVCIQRKITDSCTTDADCNPAVDQSNCTNSQCACNTGYIVNSGKTACTKRVIGDECVVDTDCKDSMDNSICIGGKCDCNVTYTPTTNNAGCTVITIGDSCTTTPTDECALIIQHSQCSGGACVCVTGYTSSSDKSQCVPITLGHACTADSQCAALANSQCKDGTCQCTSGYKASTDGSSCYKIIIGSEPCTVDSDCGSYVNNSYCVNSKCACKDGYYKNSGNTQCTKLELGVGTCDSDLSCQASVSFSVCVNGKCVCKDGYFSISTTECQKRDVGSYCETDAVCSKAINNTVCDTAASKCTCTSGYGPSDDKMTCVETVIGGNCENDADCTITVTFSRCNAGKCACIDGYKVSADKRTCTKRVLGDTCSYNSECSEAMTNSVCIGGKCACAVGYTASYLNTSCNKIPITDLPCSSDSDCSGIETGSVCTSGGTCACDIKSGYYMTPDKLYCEPYENGKARCTVNSTCTDHDTEAECRDGVCDCRLGYYPRALDGKCTKSKTGTIPCATNSYCTRYMSGTACVDGLCECACGHYEEQGGDVCTKIKLDQTCGVLPAPGNVTPDCGCAITNATCQDGTCQCKSGLTPDGDYTCLLPNITVGTAAPSTACSGAMIDCRPWLIGVIATICAVLLAAAIGLGAYYGSRHKKSRSNRAVSPTTAYGISTVHVRPCSTVPIMYESDICKEPADISVGDKDGLVLMESSVFYTPESTPSPVDMTVID